MEQPPPTTKISKLPDKIIEFMFSKLSTKEYVRTSVLSKKWETLWTKSTVLDFDDMVRKDNVNFAFGPNQVRFTQFVYSVLLRHEAKKIKRFRLQCRSTDDSHIDITSWVGHAIRREVEEVELSFLFCAMPIPWRLLHSNTVTTIKLNTVILPKMHSVHLPVLKILHLGDDVLFTSHLFLVKFLQGCPLLEDLALQSRSPCCVSHTFCFTDQFELKLERLLCVKASFFWNKECPMMKVFQAFCGTQSLSISSSLVECLMYDCLRSFPMNFNNLTQFEVAFKDYTWSLIAKLLQRSPKLEILIIHKEPSNSLVRKDPKWKGHLKFPLNLKTLSIKDYEGLESELRFVQLILGNANMLKSVTISFARSLPLEEQNKICQKLSTVSRKSDNCHVKFS